MNTPVLLLAFNRPDLTLKVYDVIRLVKPKKLYVSIDGPRLNNQTDLTNINIITSIFNNIDWDCEFKLNKFNNNLGCGMAISQGINWFFKEVEYGIILEDDTIPSISFFEITSKLLNKYSSNN